MEFTLEQANDVISNPENPNHKAFYENSNADLVNAVNRAFQTAYPGSMSFSNDLPQHINDAMNKEAGQAPQTPAPDPDPTSTPSGGDPYEYSKEQVTESLKADWGDSHELNMARVSNPDNARRVFGDFAAQNDGDRQFVNDLIGFVGNHPAGLRLYLHILRLIDRY
jgi:hypothetical protein